MTVIALTILFLAIDKCGGRWHGVTAAWFVGALIDGFLMTLLIYGKYYSSC